ncbi:MAG: class I tRNA ligase family protein, partial [Thermoplasmatales archaeon]|nr:class I tRNA ligase family protein [Thermoplasmatales archaeon]
WPCRWITEGQDQTRGWFYSQLGAGVIAFDRVPYESVLVHGWTLDKTGKPMSKSLGNVIDPLEVVDKYGVDSLRFYILSSAPWDDLLFSSEGIKNANRMLSILWNVYVFATTYMALDNFTDIEFEKIENDLKPEDKWLLSKLENLKKNVSENIGKYEIHRACRGIENFILEDLSRWYIRLIRDRTWVEEKTKDKIAAYKTLYEALKNVALLLAPVAPYLSEEIYRNLTGCISVHMGEWPKNNEKFVNPILEEHMDIIREITESVSSARQKAGIKLRWPVKRIIIETEDKNVKDAAKSLQNILLTQTNSKNIEFGKKDFPSSDFSKGTVYVDTEMTEEIKSEGFAREIIRRIQNMRKEANLNVEDFIETTVNTNPEITILLKKQEGFIKNETRTKNIAFGEAEGVLVKEWEIENEKFVIGIKKV